MRKNKRFQGIFLALLVAFLVWNLWPSGGPEGEEGQNPRGRKKPAAQTGKSGPEPLPHLDISFFTAETGALTDANGNQAGDGLQEGPAFFPRNLFKQEPDPFKIYADDLAKAKNGTESAISAMNGALGKINNLSGKSHFDRLDENLKNTVGKDVPRLLKEGKGVEVLMEHAQTIAGYDVLKGHANRVKGQANGLYQQVDNGLRKVREDIERENQEDRPPPPPKPPNINFQFVGYFGHSTNKIAVLEKTKDKEQILVYRGTAVDNLFIIEDIGYDSCLIGFVGFEDKKRIPLVGSAK